MTTGGGEAADQMVRMMLTGSEVTIRLGASALKNLAALSIAIAKQNKTLHGKVNMSKILRQTRDIRVFPMDNGQYKQFQKQAKGQKILYSAIVDKATGDVDLVMPVTELDRANHIFSRIQYRDQQDSPTIKTVQHDQPFPQGHPRGVVLPSHDSADTRISYNTSTENGVAHQRTDESLSILNRLKTLRERQTKQKAPAKMPTKTIPKDR